MLTILENCRVSPPPDTVGERSLQLTFFDLVWLTYYPIHQLFFYEFPHPKTHFIETVVPNLKHSLSITLQHFFPFAGNLIVFSTPDHSSATRKPEIRHADGDSVALTFAELDSDFDDLVGNHPRDCDKFHPLVPLLGRATKVSDYLKVPVFSIQVTFFPNSGISIGFTNQHALSDASTRFHFLKAWTSIFRHGTDELFLANGSLPFYDRVIKYPNSLDEIYLNKLGIKNLYADYQPPLLVSQVGRVRATFVLTRAHTKILKNWVSTQLPTFEYVSSFSVACAYIWSCIAKSRVVSGETKGEDELEGFNSVVDWRGRLDPSIPQAYFGNCVGLCMTITKTTKLIGDKGFITAAELLGENIRKTVKNKAGVFEDAARWLERAPLNVPIIGVSGTPKLNVYQIDFGWGKPKKYETVSIDYHRSISVNACNESPDDLEIGVSLPAKQMDACLTIFAKELEFISGKNE